MKKLFFLSLNILIGTSFFAQQGKDGAANISTANTIVNNVNTTLISNAIIGTTTIAVASSVGLAAGDLIFIMQAQGAAVNDSTNYFGNPNQSFPFDTSAGKIHKYNGAGNNEFAEINSIAGNVITLNCTLSDSFRGSSNVGDIVSQVIRVPRYTTLTLSGAGSITCNIWNGLTGGVVVIEVQSNTTLAAGTSINVTGKGFRGGSPIWATGFGSNSVGYNYGNPGTNNGGHKGESIVGDTNQYKKQAAVASVGTNFDNASYWWNSTPLTTCKGNVANGGGGGDANNCGGGGGSNGGSIALWNGMGNPDPTYASCWSKETAGTNTNGTLPPTSSSGGGRGGYAYSASSSATADPTVTGPNNAGTWGGDSRHNDGGWGGTPLDYTTGKIFFGGGGGAGDGNDGHASPGGNGGGIVYLLSYGTVTGAGQIIADGGTTLPTTSFGPGLNGDDGAGGGGGGGAVIIKSVGTVSLTAATPISAQGGKGGDNNYNGITTTKHCFGPGGGGGGGYVSTSNAVAGINVNGGLSGSVTGANNTSTIKTKFPPNGATIGGAGSTTSSTSPFYLTATNYTVCPSTSVSLSVTVNGTAPGGLAVGWYTVATGGTVVSNSNPYNITAPAAVGSYTYYAGTCPGTYRLPVVVNVTPAGNPTVTISATNTMVCAGTSVTLTVSGAMSYTWDANAGNATTNTVVVNPVSNTTYTVTGANTGSCAGTATASININANTPPTITITPTSYSLCSGINDTLTASASSTLSYTWSSNAASATTNSVIVSPAVGATTYSVTGTDGVCTSTQSVSINVTATPTVSISPTSAYICKGSSTTFTANGATTYSWSTTAITNTVSVSPASNTTYTVIGNNGNCSVTKTVLVKVDNGITKADSVTNAASCGQSNGSYVLNSITGGISPYQINFNGAGFSNISAFSYTVPNLAGNTYSITLKDSLGCTYATSVTIGNTSGITAIDTTITNANCNPPNSGAIAINSITGGSAPYQANINGGTFNTISSFPYLFPNLTAGTYTVQVKDGSGCPHSSIITVGSNGGPTSVATSTIQPDTCGKNVGTLTVGTVTGGTAPYQYSINGGTTYQSSATFTGLTGLTNYTISIKDNNGCTISSNNNLVGSISGPTSIIGTISSDTCNKHVGAINISSVTGGSAPYQYSIDGGITYQTSNIFSGLNGLTTYTVSIKDNNGCTTSNTQSVGEFTSAITPTITASGSTTLCQGGSVTLTSSSAPSYTWSTGVQTSSITVNVSGTYTVTTTSSTGCTAMDTIVVTVKNNPVAPVLNDTTITECQNTVQAIHFTNSVGTLIIHNAAGQVQSLPFTPSTSVAGAIVYTAYDSLNGCISAVKNITINVNQTPATVPTVTTPVTYCYGAKADTLQAVETVSGADLNWEDASHNTILTPPTPTPLTTILGTTTYYVYQSINSVNNVCKGPRDSIKVTILPKPSVSFTYTPSPEIFVGQTVSFLPTPTNTLYTYSWNFNDPTSSSNTSSSMLPTHVYDNAGTSYCASLVVIDNSSPLKCKDSTSLCLDILMNVSLTIPNVFSPNDDGINDYFSIKSTGIVDLTCDIFDRWGLKLYSWNGVTGAWDGTEKTKKAVEGTYYYVLQTTDVKGVSQTSKGFVELVR